MIDDVTISTVPLVISSSAPGAGSSADRPQTKTWVARLRVATALAQCLGLL